MGLLAAGGMSAQTSYTPSTLTKDGGTYYVYNPSTKLWLQGNTTVANGWTTGLNVGTIGLPFIFHNPGESTAYPGYHSWFIDGQFASNGNIDGASDHDGGLLYLDHSNWNEGWDVSPATDFPAYPNAYIIEGGAGYIFGVDQEETPAKLSLATDNESNAWILVTPENRLAVDAANATPENPADVTYLIKGSNLPNAYKPWHWVSVENDMDNGSGIGPISTVGGDNIGVCAAQRVHEYWSTKAFDFYQVITDIPNGTYEFSVRGFYRDGSRKSQQEEVANGESDNLLAYLYIELGDSPMEHRLASISEGINKLPGFGWEGPVGYQPDDAWSAIDYFELGQYKNTTSPFELKEGETLTFGIAKDEENDGDWIVVDNFQLIYFGTKQPTAIKGISATDATGANAHTYNIAGQRVGKGYKGIVIQDGKKRIVR